MNAGWSHSYKSPPNISYFGIQFSYYLVFYVCSELRTTFSTIADRKLDNKIYDILIQTK